MFSDHTLVEEQALLIAELEERFHESSARLAALQADLDFSAEAWLKLKESIARDRLTGRTVLLVGDGDVFLSSLLQRAGAQVEVARLEDLGQLAFPAGLSVVFPLSSEVLSSAEREAIAALSAAGARLSFVWAKGLKPPLSELPPSLQVDSIDTSVGEIAFLLALSAGVQGRYGLQPGAEGLFP